MPTLKNSKLPKPTDSDEFENMVLSACKIKWDSPNFQKNGRRGQSQDGVDLVGLDDLMRMVGIQCKNYSAGIESSLVTSEIALAENFEPKISAYYIACSSEYDSKLQKEVRIISLERISQGKFPVSIIFWDDIIDALLSVRSEFSKYYPEIQLSSGVDPNRKDNFIVNIFTLSFQGFLITEYLDLILGNPSEDRRQIKRIIMELTSSASICLSDPIKSEYIENLNDLHDIIFSDRFNHLSVGQKKIKMQSDVENSKGILRSLENTLDTDAAFIFSLAGKLSDLDRQVLDDCDVDQLRKITDEIKTYIDNMELNFDDKIKIEDYINKLINKNDYHTVNTADKIFWVVRKHLRKNRLFNI